jgi:hypothetical protein
VLDRGGGRRVSGWRPCRVKVVAGEQVVAVLGRGGSRRPCWGRGGSGRTGCGGCHAQVDVMGSWWSLPGRCGWVVATLGQGGRAVMRDFFFCA